MTQCVVVADDVTGSADTGHEFARRGYTTEIALTQKYGPSTSDVVVHNTDSRYVPPPVARTRVEAALSDPAPVVYKKIDSTLRGNVVSEVEAVIAAAAPNRAVVAPAFPSNGRLTACGFHLVAGEMVTESDVGDDSDHPASHDSLPDLFAESRYPVAHIGIDTVARGPSSIATVLDRSGHVDGPGIVTCDAVDETHLASIADACESLSDRCAFVGSGGLARHIALPGAPTEEPSKPDVSSGQPVIGVSGSTAKETLTQVREIPRVLREKVAFETAAVDPATAGSELAKRGRATLVDQGCVLLISADTRDDVKRALTAGEQAGIDDQTMKGRINQTLAIAVTEIVQSGEIPNLFLTGGEIATVVLSHLGTSGLRMLGEQVARGIPLASAIGGMADRSVVVTKAGGFGAESAMIKSLTRLGYQHE